jgi:hypothetical protein
MKIDKYEIHALKESGCYLVAVRLPGQDRVLADYGIVMMCDPCWQGDWRSIPLATREKIEEYWQHEC